MCTFLSPLEWKVTSTLLHSSSSLCSDWLQCLAHPALLGSHFILELWSSCVLHCLAVVIYFEWAQAKNGSWNQWTIFNSWSIIQSWQVWVGTTLLVSVQTEWSMLPFLYLHSLPLPQWPSIFWALGTSSVERGFSWTRGGMVSCGTCTPWMGLCLFAMPGFWHVAARCRSMDKKLGTPALPTLKPAPSPFYLILFLIFKLQCCYLVALKPSY